MNVNGVLRLTTTINPTLFSKELEYLYTGKGFGEAFEFLFDSAEHREEGDAEENRIDKLRKDMVFMWRSRLYSDVRLTIEGRASSSHENTAAVFSTHRFILVSRSAYFHNALIAWGNPSTKSGELPNLTLPSPPFTPPALHFILGFIYTGTLIFSNRSYDLDTAFHIMRSATYLSLDTLYDEVQARIVVEMMHGLFHAFLEFTEYERVTGGKWGVGGCRCRQCARRVPRVLEFALLDDVKNSHLERGARRALVGLFGEGWCNPEFANLDKKIRETALKGVAKRTTPNNIFPLLYAADFALGKLENVIDAWTDVVKDMILEARKLMDRVLNDRTEECLQQDEWEELMQADGVRFEDGEKVELITDSLKRGFNDKSAGMVYQVLVSSVLLRPHATDPNQTMLSQTSHIRVQIEQARMDVVRWLKKRWLGIRNEGGFNGMETWALKELAHELALDSEDLKLLSPGEGPPKGSPGRSGVRSGVGRPDPDGESMSLHSLRTSVLNRNMAKTNGPSNTTRETVTSSAASVRSVARSTYSTSSRASSASTSTPPRRIPATSLNLRPDSKLTPSKSPSRATSPSSTIISEEVPEESPKSTMGSSSTSNTPRSSIVSSRTVDDGPSTPSPAPRPKSSAASLSSVRSHASTIRKTPTPSTKGTPTPSLRVPSTSGRPSSASSHTTTDGSTVYKTAKSDLTSTVAGRTRRASVSSAVSSVSVKTTVSTKAAVRPRRPSVSSTMSTLSTTSKVKKPAASTTTDATKRSLSASGRPPSAASVRSTTASIRSTATTPSVKKVVTKPKPSESPTKTMSKTTSGPSGTIKAKGKAIPPVPALSSASTSTLASSPSNSEVSTPSTAKAEPAKPSPVKAVKDSMKRKSSTDTITKFTVGVITKPPPEFEGPTKLDSLSPTSLDSAPRGATLEVGIPCIISAKRARFRAFARYIGEVEGETGPWVGVEVPLTDNGGTDKVENRQWNDGTWGGIKYFDLSVGSEWDYSEERAARRRRLDWSGGSTLGRDGLGKGSKREGDQMDGRSKRFRAVSPAVSDVTNTTESKGLFVRPQQVLYVIDAVGADF